jgi:hypothetical protein
VPTAQSNYFAGSTLRGGNATNKVFFYLEPGPCCSRSFDHDLPGAMHLSFAALKLLNKKIPRQLAHAPLSLPLQLDIIASTRTINYTSGLFSLKLPLLLRLFSLHTEGTQIGNINIGYNYKLKQKPSRLRSSKEPGL